MSSTERQPIVERVREVTVQKRFRSPSCLFCWVTTLAIIAFVVAIVRSVAATETNIYVDGLDTTIADIPRYTRAGSNVDPLTALSLGFHFWWISITNALDLSLPFVALFLLAWKARIGNWFYLVIVLSLLVQLATSIYYSFYFFSILGLSCAQHAHCIQRDPSQAADKPSFAFSVYTFASYIFLFLTLLYFPVPGFYKRAVTPVLDSELNYKSLGSQAGKKAKKSPDRLL